LDSETYNKNQFNGETYNKNQFNGVQSRIIYCNECGKRFSEKMIRKMQLNGNVFCVNCGKEFDISQFQISLIH